MELWKGTTAALVLYIVTSCNAEITSNELNPRSVVRPGVPGATALANRATSTNASTNTNGGGYAWSQWGSWSQCSRSCGGGVSVQERHCISSDTNRWVRGRKRRRLPPDQNMIKTPNYRKNPTEHNGRIKNDLSPKVETPKTIREIKNNRIEERSDKTAEKGDRKENSDVIEDLKSRTRRWARRDAKNTEVACKGLSKRYHECNTAPCGGPQREPRTEQCSNYDRRPFKGRFYTWVPYHDAEFPCALTCRPRGQHFYASLGIVADGTPCTRPGFRAICVQGSCKYFQNHLNCDNWD